MTNKKPLNLNAFMIPVLLLSCLVFIRWQYGVLLFHTLAELFAVTVGILMLVIVWNTRRFAQNDFLLYLGIGYFWIAVLDIWHTFTIGGMPFLETSNPEITLHFWIYTRFFEAVLLLSAVLFLKRKLNTNLMFSVSAALVLLVIWASVTLKEPVMMTSEGLTAFKINIEYFIMALLGLAIFIYIRLREWLTPKVLYFLLSSMLLTIFAELSFTLYSDFQGIPFVIGHLFKFLSFWMIYQAIVQTTLNEPFTILAQASNSYDAIPHSAVVVDSQGMVSQVNRAAEKSSGKPIQQLLHQPIHPLFHPTDISEEVCELCQAIKQGKPVEGLIVPFPESKQWFLASLAPIKVGDKASGMVQLLTDVTERKQIEEALRRSQKMEAIGQLSGGISHDFNNQLGIVIGYLDFLKDHTAKDKELHQWVNIATTAALRCVDLTRKLLVFSRHQTKEKTVVDLNDILRKQETIIARSLTPEVEVQYFLADDLWTTEIDPGEFQDAILNLVINARDAMPHGGKLLVETSNRHLNEEYVVSTPELESGDYVQLMISDTGTGMDNETQEHIFEPYFTTKPEGKGTGLGMSMVYGFVKRYGGEIKLYSELGIGTTIRLYLPRSHVNETDFAGSAPRETALPNGCESILIVDDEADLLQLASCYLNDLGYRTEVAENAAQALEKLAGDKKFDLLFSDVVMPGSMNGYQLAQQATEQRPELKVLLTSGFTSKTIAHNGLARFTAHLLGKPYRKIDLALHVRKVLDEKNAT